MHIPAVDIDELECGYIVQSLVKKYGKTPLWEFRIDTLPTQTWNDLFNKGAFAAMETRKIHVFRALSRTLLEAIQYIVDTTTLKRLGNLKRTVNVRHASAFFRYVSFPPALVDGETTLGKLYSYSEVAEWMGNYEGEFEMLMESYRDVEEEEASMWKGRWQADHIATEIGLALLEEMGYMGKNATKVTGGPAVLILGGGFPVTVPTFASMKDMEAKGKVFVCMRCPEGGRGKRTWKELVRAEVVACLAGR